MSVDNDDDDEDGAPALPQGLKNYITPVGYARLLAESEQLYKVERPELTRVVAWAASNGDRSENGDYLYGKRRLREIDKRLRYLKKQLDNAEVVDPTTRNTEQVFFAATVDYLDLGDDSEHTVSIVGIDEADVARGLISWRSPLALCLTKARSGDSVKLAVPDLKTGQKRVRELEILDVRYEQIKI